MMDIAEDWLGQYSVIMDVPCVGVNKRPESPANGAARWLPAKTTTARISFMTIEQGQTALSLWKANATTIAPSLCARASTSTSSRKGYNRNTAKEMATESIETPEAPG